MLYPDGKPKRFLEVTMRFCGADLSLKRTSWLKDWIGIKLWAGGYHGYLYNVIGKGNS